MLHFSTHVHPNSTEWVTFVHGAGGSSAIWHKQLKSFSKEFNVLLLDLRGHGRSKGPTNETYKRYSFDSIGNDVIEVLDHLKIQSTHFVGISLGTIIIREITERFPERTKSMILGGAVMKINVQGQILMRLGSLTKSVIPYLVMYRFLAWVIMPKKNHRESRLLFINEAKRLYQKEFIRWFTLISQVNALLKLFRIKDAKKPTLYIMGEDDHMFLPSITKLVEHHTSSKLHVVPNCGHVVNVEQPDHFNEVVITFIQQVPS
ncbi:MAG: alpha/beta hydrolase [Cryomorphaceae bacterium]|jgi:pimeloyl-ACP methyl ester carboxylesterase|nr:alpha/beta hydrolase [Cryomorphaceae bacterium]